MHINGRVFYCWLDLVAKNWEYLGFDNEKDIESFLWVKLRWKRIGVIERDCSFKFVVEYEFLSKMLFNDEKTEEFNFRLQRLLGRWSIISK